MDSAAAFILGLIAYIFHMMILSWVIRKSVKAGKNQVHDEVMINLLMAIARKNGATEQEIGAAIGKKLG